MQEKQVLGHALLLDEAPIPANNGAVLNTPNLIKTVMSSAAEAEMGTIFLNAREAIPARKARIEMGHPQGQTSIQTDNSTAEGVCNNNMQCKRSKSWDMRFYWMRCKESQKMFRVFWRPRTTNLAEYFNIIQLLITGMYDQSSLHLELL